MNDFNIYTLYKLRNYGIKNSFNEKFRHVFWFNVIYILFRLFIIIKKLIFNSINFYRIH